MVFRMGDEFLIRHGKASGKVSRTFEDIKILMREKQYDKFLVNLKGRGKGVLHTSSENILDKENDGVFIFVCWYFSDPRLDKLQTLLLAYAPKIEGCFSTPYLVPVEPRTFDFVKMFMQVLTEENYGKN